MFAGPTSGAAAIPTFRLLVAADLPVFVASGASHAAGAVPDPGSTAGSARYLREDCTWQVPPGSGGSSTLSGLTDVSVTEGAGINGYSLTWNNSTGKWVATNVSAGSGMSDDAVHYSGANHPTITGFSTQQSTNMTGGVNTLANLASGRGFTHTIQPPSTAAAEYHSYITQPVPAGSSWAIIAMMAWNAGTYQTYNKAGLLVMDASGNWVAFGHSFANTGQQGRGAYLAAAGLNTTPTNVPISGVPPAGPPCWFKLTYASGGNFVFYTSVDGETWVQRYSVSVTAVIGTPTKTGLYNNCNDQSGVAVANMSCVLSVYHYFQG
ncbi:hypothetical protein [Paraburkholderia panacisoli]|uniref:hypothetical protein n=1 Tax=Paraburkholderia panacisoli TaxID=2603818 RepID=UPI00165ED222|nr:hypothetical protein [Paraburkholderia panacisoli]